MKHQESWTPQSYLDQLRPDAGWTVSLGLFATYSAEMFAVAATLLALIGRQNGRGSGASAHVIDAVEQLRSCVRIMAQAGRISPPEDLPKIAGIFDQFIVDVPFAEAKHSWHPKIALVRYSSPVRDDRWRLWIGSRNLTGSRDLEAGLLLDGAVARRSGSRLLPGVADLGRQIAGRSGLAIADPVAIAAELDRMRWTSPSGTRATDVEFLPGGGSRAYGPPSGELDRLIVVSPFLCSTFLEHAGSWGSGTTRRTLVSTEAAIRSAALSKRSRLDRFDELLVFDAPELTSLPSTATDTVEAGDDEAVEPISLHAKMLVFRQPTGARLVIGSANATDRAWSGRNAEVIATLDVDDRTLAGIDDLCGRARPIDVSDIRSQSDPDDAVARFERCRRRISSDWPVSLTRVLDVFSLDAVTSPPLPADYRLSACLATQGEAATWPGSETTCQLGSVPIYDQTALVRFELDGDGRTETWARVLDVSPPIDEGRDHAAFGRHLGPRALAAWLRGMFQPEMATAPDGDWDRPVAGRRDAGGMLEDERLTMEEILLAWARDPDGFARIDGRFRRMLAAIVEHGDVLSVADQKRLSDIKDVWKLAQSRLGRRR